MIDISNEIKKSMVIVLDFVKDKMREELIDQGHVMTGTLRDSIDVVIKEAGEYIYGFIEVENYGLVVDGGIKAKKIPYSRGSGAKRSKYIEALIRFFQYKGLALKEARSAAFATANVHKVEGLPTFRSHSFAANGRRTGFIRYTIDVVTPNIDSMMTREIDKNVFDKIISTLESIN